MSLIICRNRPNESDVVGTSSSIYEPWSFRNQLTSNIEVPANSQIALQSVKINMDGSLVLGDDSKIFYIYFGPTIVGDDKTPADGQMKNMDESPFIPLQVSLFKNQSHLQKVSVEDLQREIQSAVNRTITNPNLKNRFSCSTEKNADGSLKGFKFIYDERITGAGFTQYAATNTLPPVFNYANSRTKGMLEGSYTAKRLYQLTNSVEGQAPSWGYTILGAPFNTAEFDITTLRIQSRSCIANVSPLNMKSGTCKFNIDGSIKDTGRASRFMVGLTRPSRGSYILPTGRRLTQKRIRPPWYRHGNGSVDRAWMSAFADYAVWFDHAPSNPADLAYTGRLVVGHTVVNTDDIGGQTGSVAGNKGRLKLQRLGYGDGSGTYDTGTSALVVSSAGWSDLYGYDLATNPLQIEFVSFFVNGGQVSIKLTSNTATGSTVYDLITYNKDRKQASLLKPINQNTETLLPLMLLNNGGNNPATGTNANLALKEWDGNNVSVPNYDLFSDDENFNGFMDRIYNSNMSTGWRAREIDEQRLCWNYTPSVIGTAVSLLKPYPGVVFAGVRQFDNISHNWSVLPNNLYGGDYGAYTAGANTAVMLGFPNMPNVGNWGLDALGFRELSSFQPPLLLPSRSVFVRLENFGNESINAFQGLKSKIIAHLPRFDGTNSIGPLYLEPNNLVYIDLKNPQSFRINSFDISLCYADETYATALQGTTIVCLHLREKP